MTIATGFISTIAGKGTSTYSGDGGAATSAEVYLPSGVVVDSSGSYPHYYSFIHLLINEFFFVYRQRVPR